MTVSADRRPVSRDTADAGAARERFLHRLLAGETAADAAQAAVDAARDATEADLSWCGTLSEDCLTMAAHSGLRTTDMVAGLWRLGVGEGVGGRVARDGRPLVCRDYRHDPRRVPEMKKLIDAEGLTSTVVVPLLNGREVLGVLYTGQRVPRDWHQAEVDSLSAIGRDAGLMLARIRQRRAQERFAEVADRARHALDVAADIAAGVGESDDIGAGLWVLAQQLGRRLELLDTTGTVLREVPARSSCDPAWAPWLAVPIGLAGFGALRVCAEPPLEAVDEELVRLGAGIIGLQLRRVRAALTESTRLQGGQLSDLFDRRRAAPAVMRETAALLGLDLAAPHFVACVGSHFAGTGARDGEHALSPRRGSVSAALRARFPDLVLIARGDHAAVMIPAGGASTAQVQANLRQALAGAEPPLAAGIGRMCTGFDNYIDSYHEASACLAAARRRSAPGEVLSAADVGVLDWLTHKSGPGPYPDVVADTLGPLLQADEETGSEYVKTLDAFLSNDRHLDKTALALNVHPNTVRYRVGKAQERLGVDLHNVDARFMIELALRVHAARPPEDIQEH